MKYCKIVRIAREIAQYPNKTVKERIKLTSKKLGISEGEVIVALAKSQLEFIDFAYTQKQKPIPVNIRPMQTKLAKPVLELVKTENK